MPAAPAFLTRRDLGPRGVSLALSLALVAGLILALLGLGVSPPRFFSDRPLATFDVREGERAPQASPKPVRRAESVARRAPTPPPPPAPEVEPPPEFPPEIIRLSRSDFQRWAVAPRSAAPAPASEPGEQSADAGSTARVGTGPNGQPLYAADWYREPTRAQMATYLAKTRPGWGVVACKTAPRYRVTDCVELGESPGSGIAGAVRQAAWQFLVLPPRIGGKPMIGEWVRIRFDLTADNPG